MQDEEKLLFWQIDLYDVKSNSDVHSGIAYSLAFAYWIAAYEKIRTSESYEMIFFSAAHSDSNTSAAVEPARQLPLPLRLVLPPHCPHTALHSMPTHLWEHTRNHIRGVSQLENN